MESVDAELRANVNPAGAVGAVVSAGALAAGTTATTVLVAGGFNGIRPPDGVLVVLLEPPPQADSDRAIQ